MYQISLEIAAFFMSVFSFVYCITARHLQYIPPKGIKNKLANQHFVFLLMLITNILSAASSVIGVYLTPIASGSIVFWQYLFHAFYFFFHATLSVSFTLYIMNVTGTGVNKGKLFHALFWTPYIISELIVLTNSWTQLAFYMDSEYNYHRGVLMPLLYAIGGIYIVLGFVFFFKNKKAISKADSIAVGVFIGIATLGIIVQAIWSNLLVELYCESLACLVLMMVLEEKAGHVDSVTGLLNNIAFIDDNRKFIGSNQKYAIVQFKVSGFDRITRNFGERDGDAFLMRVAAFMTASAETPLLYNLRREEFAAIFKEDDMAYAEEFAQCLIERFRQEWTVESVDIVVDAIAVVAHVPEDLHTLEDIEYLFFMRYQKNKAGSFIIPFEDIQSQMKARNYEEALRNAIKDNKLMLEYQPIWSIKNRRTEAAEALLRVDVDELRHISPETYIQVAEKSGLIKEIGLFVFEEVCRFLKDERLNGTNIRYITMNLSSYQFLYGDLVESFEAIREKYGISSKRINLEITETASFVEKDEVLETVDRFKRLGYAFSLDDFGTGYSNFMQIIKSHFDNIKIDKSILWDIKEDENGKDVLRNIINFIRGQGSNVIQEGVETKEQFDIVSECGGDYIQGFYFSRPVGPDEFFDYLEKEKNTNQ